MLPCSLYSPRLLLFLLVQFLLQLSFFIKFSKPFSSNKASCNVILPTRAPQGSGKYVVAFNQRAHNRCQPTCRLPSPHNNAQACSRRAEVRGAKVGSTQWCVSSRVRGLGGGMRPPSVPPAQGATHPSPHTARQPLALRPPPAPPRQPRERAVAEPL